MRQGTKIRLGWFITLLVLSGIAFFPIQAQVLPGANFVGDCDNAMIDTPDLGALDAYLANIDPGCVPIPPFDRPRTAYWFDLDGNGTPDSPDYGILDGWLANIMDLSGNPTEIIIENTSINVAEGDLVELKAKALSGTGAGRVGWGIVFEITGGSCATAQIWGRDVNNGEHYGWYNTKAFEYTGEPADGFYARVKLKASGCTTAQTVQVSAYIPGGNARFPAQLDAAGQIQLSVCTDNDQDGRGSGCVQGSDCNDNDTDNWSKCSTCADHDYDGWYKNCDRYVNRDGPDCNDYDLCQWECCGCCPKDCYYCGGCDVCIALYEPVCVESWYGECYVSNSCWAYVMCWPIICYMDDPDCQCGGFCGL